jgi:transcriptional regulator with XRE-family HTH domain
MTRSETTPTVDRDLGPRLRLLRETRALSLRALAKLAGVNPGTLSQIENGKTSPSVSTLKTVLLAMGTSLGEFFSMQEKNENGRSIVFRPSQLVDISPGPGIKFLTLPGATAGRALQCLHETYAPGADTGPEAYRHPGEETGFCLSGTIEITVADQREILGPGDAYYYSSEEPHRWRNVGKSPAEVISCCTPPTF